MSQMHVVCREGELGDGQSGTIEVDGKTIALFRQGDSYYAIDDTCPHMGASLSSGTVEDGVVTCPWHYWQFRLENGRGGSPKIEVACYPVHIKDGLIQIEVAPKTPKT